jgi:hypothetical protein
MTDEQLRIRVASLDSRARMGEWQFEILQECLSGDLTRVEYLPDYPNDLNAIHEVEKTLTGEKRYALVDILCAVARRDHDPSMGPATAICEACFATARQRAEAYVKTMEAI